MHASTLPTDVARLVRSGPFTVVALGSLVWLFAFIGMFGVARTVFASGSATDVAFAPADSIVPGLPAFPGAACAERRDQVFEGERVTEVEYVVECSLPEVRDHYSAAFASEGWTVHDALWERGELVFKIERGPLSGEVELEHDQGVTEIEVELSERADAGTAGR